MTEHRKKTRSDEELVSVFGVADYGIESVAKLTVSADFATNGVDHLWER